MTKPYLAVAMLTLIAGASNAAPPTPEEILIAPLVQRIAKLEAKIEMLEGMLRPGQSGNPSTLEAPRNLNITAVGETRLTSGKTLHISGQDKIVIQSGRASISMQKNGDIEIRGERILIHGDKVDVKGQHDLILKGNKISSN